MNVLHAHVDRLVRRRAARHRNVAVDKLQFPASRVVCDRGYFSLDNVYSDRSAIIPIDRNRSPCGRSTVPGDRVFN
jgi:hypothetical protein